MESFSVAPESDLEISIVRDIDNLKISYELDITINNSPVTANINMKGRYEPEPEPEQENFMGITSWDDESEDYHLIIDMKLKITEGESVFEIFGDIDYDGDEYVIILNPLDPNSAVMDFLVGDFLKNGRKIGDIEIDQEGVLKAYRTDGKLVFPDPD